MQILFKIEVLSSGGPIDETLRNQAFTILDGQSFSIDFPWESDTVIQLTPVFGKVHERFSVMNRPLQFEIPGRSQVTIKGTVGQKDGAEAIKFSVRLDDQVLATRTFYGSPLRPEEEEEKSYLTGKGRELPY